MFSGIDDINNFSQSRTLHTVVQSGTPFVGSALTSDQINALAPFANSLTSVNNTTPLYALAGSAGGGGVSQIVAGTNVSISPAGGTGVVTVNAAGGGGSNVPDQSFSTITLATGGSIFGAGANMNISTINGVVPGGTAVPDIVASTITLGATSTAAGGKITVLPGGVASYAALAFRNQTDIFNTFALQSGFNQGTNQYFTTITQDTGVGNSGLLNITNFENINAPTLNLNISTINGVVPGGGTAVPDPSFSTITLATGGSIFADAANMNISSINGAAPAAPPTYVRAAESTATILFNTSGSGATSISANFNANIASPNQTTAPVGNFGINVAPGSGIDVLNPVWQTLPAGALDPGYWSITIPVTLQLAQNPVGTPAITSVTPGTNITHAIICGDIDNQTVTPLLSVAVVPSATGAVSVNSVSLLLQGVFFNPAASVTTVFKLRAWAPVPTGGTNSGSWTYTVPGTGVYVPKIFLQRVA